MVKRLQPWWNHYFDEPMTQERRNTHDNLAHIDEDVLEQYAMGQLDPDSAQLATVEEHLLICSACQQSLQELERFLAALRHADESLKQSES